MEDNCTVIEKLRFLLESKALIKEALVVSGSDVSDDTTMREYAQKIIELRRVSSVNGMTGDVVLSANDVNAYSKEEIDGMHWYGTIEEYNSISEKNPKCEYHIYENKD